MKSMWHDKLLNQSSLYSYFWSHYSIRLQLMKLHDLRKVAILSVIMSFLYPNAHSQDFLMQGWYWDYPKTTDGNNWADSLGLRAGTLSDAGFTHLWLPPLPRASFSNNSNGYDPYDLYDYGEYGGATGFGSRADLDSLVNVLNASGIEAVADMIYNHRDGGAAELNPAVGNYVRNLSYTTIQNGGNPFPYDRYFCALPLGGVSGNGAGDYYFKISSASGHPNFNNWEYKVYMETNIVGWQNMSDLTESEPNGGGDCSQGNNDTFLGRNMNAWIDDPLTCRTDEFHLYLSTSDYDSDGDTLFIYFGKRNSGYTDMRVYGIWSSPRNQDIVEELDYYTWTDFTAVPSSQGLMDWNNFKPNNDNSTELSGDWDYPYFFYDYDQFQNDTRQQLIDWTQWNWSEIGIRGLRMDAIKHFTPEFVGDLLDSLHASGMDPGMVVGEWYGTNTGELSGWINSVYNYMDASTQSAILPRIFDFSLRENLRKACDDNGFDVRNVFQGSIADVETTSGFNVVTFVNNHDFRDNSGFASLIQNDAGLAYAYILLNNQLGLPTVFYPDYFGYPQDPVKYPYHPANADTLKDHIDKMIIIHKTYTDGTSSRDYLNRFSSPYSSNFISGSSDKCLIFQLSGATSGKEMIVAINFATDTLKVDHGIKLVNGLGTGTDLCDIGGNSSFPYATVNGSGQIYIQLPPKSWSVWVQGNPLPPLTPAGMKIIFASEDEIGLSWKDISTNESGFIVERKTGAGGSWTVVDTVAANATLFADSTATTAGIEYYYRVYGYNSSGNSAYSNEVISENRTKWMGFSSDWADPFNWSASVVPGIRDHVLVPDIPAGGNHPQQNSVGNASVKAISIENGASWTLPSGIQVNVTGY